MHRIRTLALGALVLAMLLPTAATAASPRDRATGGGQILVGTDGGAGSTIAFTAQETVAGGSPTDVKGQIQFIERTGGTGRGQVRGHYEVDCLEVTGNTAYIAGVLKNGDGTTSERIYLEVVDNGEGANAMGADIVTVNRDADPDDDGDDDAENACDVPEGGTVSLARGNAQVHDATQ
jgi:hypothetical protein